MALTTCSVCYRSWRAFSSDEACPWCDLTELREGISCLVAKDEEVATAQVRLDKAKDAATKIDMFLVLRAIRRGLGQQNLRVTRDLFLPHGSVIAAMRPLSLYLRSLGLDPDLPRRKPLRPSDVAMHEAACPTCGRLNCPSCNTAGCPD